MQAEKPARKDSLVSASLDPLPASQCLRLREGEAKPSIFEPKDRHVVNLFNCRDQYCYNSFSVVIHNF